MDIVKGLEERRSINFFDPNKSVDDKTIDRLIDLANLTPSSFNLQPWEIIVVKSKEAKKKLRAVAFNQPKIEEAAFDIIVIANTEAVELHVDDVLNSMEQNGYIKNEQKANMRQMPFNLYGTDDSLQRKIFAVKNTSFFAMSLMVAAKGLGLESHPMDGFNEDGVKKEFGIDARKIIPVIIAVGYPVPDLKLLPRNYRRKIADFVKKL